MVILFLCGLGMESTGRQWRWCVEVVEVVAVVVLSR